MSTVRLIESEETYPLRLSVLWPHYTKLSECSLSDDAQLSTFHVGVEVNGEIQSVATFLKEQNSKLSSGTHYRLRAMATQPKSIGKGFGKMVVNFAIDKLTAEKIELIWCDARKVAIDFYKKIGFEIVGNYYNIRNIGLHKLAYKKLK